MTKVHLTHRALIDIQDIYEYSTSVWGIKIAEKYLSNIQETLIFIGQNSGVLKINPEISSRFKAYQIQSHWLICDLVGEDIYVLTIKHISMNLLGKLKELSPTLEEEAKILYKRLKK